MPPAVKQQIGEIRKIPFNLRFDTQSLQRIGWGKCDLPLHIHCQALPIYCQGLAELLPRLGRTTARLWQNYCQGLPIYCQGLAEKLQGLPKKLQAMQ